MPKDNFPVTSQSLTIDEVVDYLLELKARGFRVERHPRADGGKCYSVFDGDGLRKTILQDASGAWRLATSPAGRVSVDPIWSAEDLRNRLGFEPDIRPASIRTARDKAASNITQIAHLLGGQQIQAVFDPFLDDRGLAFLGSVVNIGADWSNPVRLLTSSKVDPPKLTVPFFKSFLTDRALKGELRSMTHKEHRRFLLLSSGKALIVGFSWNKPAHAEVVLLEPDVQDRPFFNAEWATATPILAV